MVASRCRPFRPAEGASPEARAGGMVASRSRPFRPAERASPEARAEGTALHPEAGILCCDECCGPLRLDDGPVLTVWPRRPPPQEVLSVAA